MKTVLFYLGRKRAGKDTSINEYIENNQLDASQYEVMRYAKLIKDVAKDIFGEDFDNDDVKEVPQTIKAQDFQLAVEKHFSDLFSQSQMTEEQKQKFHDVFDDYLTADKNHYEISSRRFQQLYGSDFSRFFDDDIFIKKTIDDVIKMNKDVIFIADARFPRELALSENMLKQHNIQTQFQYVFRSIEENGIHKTFNEQYDTHISEKMANEAEQTILYALNKNKITAEDALKSYFSEIHQVHVPISIKYNPHKPDEPTNDLDVKVSKKKCKI